MHIFLKVACCFAWLLRVTEIGLASVLIASVLSLNAIDIRHISCYPGYPYFFLWYDELRVMVSMV